MDWFDLGDVEGRMHAKSGRQHKYQCFGAENQVNLMCSNITEGQFAVEGSQPYLLSQNIWIALLSVNAIHKWAEFIKPLNKGMHLLYAYTIYCCLLPNPAAVWIFFIVTIKEHPGIGQVNTFSSISSRVYSLQVLFTHLR